MCEPITLQPASLYFIFKPYIPLNIKAITSYYQLPEFLETTITISSFKNKLLTINSALQ